MTVSLEDKMEVPGVSEGSFILSGGKPNTEEKQIVSIVIIL